MQARAQACLNLSTVVQRCAAERASRLTKPSVAVAAVALEYVLQQSHTTGTAGGGELPMVLLPHMTSAANLQVLRGVHISACMSGR
jgi:hypothetical protein